MRARHLRPGRISAHRRDELLRRQRRLLHDLVRQGAEGRQHPAQPEGGADDRGRRRVQRAAREVLSRHSDYLSFTPRCVTMSSSRSVSMLICSTSAGMNPPAAKWPVMESGLMGTVRTSRMYLAASSGSHSGLSRSFVPVMIKVFALMTRRALT